MTLNFLGPFDLCSEANDVLYGCAEKAASGICLWYLDKHFKGFKVWVPSKDTGVDLLVTDSRNRNAVSPVLWVV